MLMPRDNFSYTPGSCRRGTDVGIRKACPKAQEKAQSQDKVAMQSLHKGISRYIVSVIDMIIYHRKNEAA
jgi:hypothetical protein